MSVTTTNMNLLQPTIGVDTGLTWENNVNTNSSTIDVHNHSSGSGVQINPAGLNINSDLPFNNQNATILRSVRFLSQSSVVLATDVGCLYESGVDLYYNDGSGNVIRLTQSGSVIGSAGTITGLPSGTASASYGAGVFVFQSATNTSAVLDGGSYIFRNNVASSPGLTLSAPTLASDYSLVLPSIPASLSFVTLDASGNIGTASGVSAAQITTGTIMGSQIASNTITGSQIASNTITRANLTAVGQQLSASCGSFSTSSTTYVPVTNLSVSITTTGSPVMLMLIDDSSGSASSVQVSTSTSGVLSELLLAFNRGATVLTNMTIFAPAISGGNFVGVPPSSFQFLDTPTAGNYTYTVSLRANSSTTTCAMQRTKLLAYEL
jgi:hypothetical protein